MSLSHQVSNCHVFDGPLSVIFLNLTVTLAIVVLPRSCAMLYCMLDAQLFLQPHLVAHREHSFS
jgi:hypothetical protein